MTLQFEAVEHRSDAAKGQSQLPAQLAGQHGLLDQQDLQGAQAGVIDPQHAGRGGEVVDGRWPVPLGRHTSGAQTGVPIRHRTTGGTDVTIAIDIPLALAIAGLGLWIVFAPSLVPGLTPPMSA